MKSIGLIIKQLMSEKNVDVPTLAKMIGKSRQAVYDILEKDDLNTALLRQLADVFGVPVTFFFPDGQVTTTINATANNNSVAAINGNVNVGGGDVALLQERITLLEKLVEEKERLIQVLMR